MMVTGYIIHNDIMFVSQSVIHCLTAVQLMHMYHFLYKLLKC